MDEEQCLPCVYGCEGTTVDGDQYCTVCSEPFRSAPSLLLGCGHVIHDECARGLLGAGYSGPRISFGFMGCPQCRVRPLSSVVGVLSHFVQWCRADSAAATVAGVQARITHPTLADVLEPHIALENKVREKALLRLKCDVTCVFSGLSLGVAVANASLACGSFPPRLIPRAEPCPSPLSQV